MRRLACLALFLFIASSFCAFSQEVASPAHHVSQTVPVGSSSRELSAERAQTPHAAIAQPSAAGLAGQGNTWQLLATLPGIIIHDVAFPTDKIGYAVGEEGQVWKTTDGGTNWVQQELSNAQRLLLRRGCHHGEAGCDLRIF